jgi:hypothetical protein
MVPTQHVWIVLALGSAAVFSCLATEDKTRCQTTGDCLGARVCLDMQCSDAACEALCVQTCRLAIDCDLETTQMLDCDRCEPGSETADALGIPEDATSCRAVAEGADAWQCSDLTCTLECLEVCDWGVACDDVADRAVCLQGCIASACDLPPASAQCPEGPSHASCYELRGLFGDASLCNEPRPCETTGHPCERNGHCCGFFDGFSTCVNSGSEAHCADLCLSSVECVSECCVPVLDEAYGACGVGSLCL